MIQILSPLHWSQPELLAVIFITHLNEPNQTHKRHQKHISRNSHKTINKEMTF